MDLNIRIASLTVKVYWNFEGLVRQVTLIKDFDLDESLCSV